MLILAAYILVTALVVGGTNWFLVAVMLALFVFGTHALAVGMYFLALPRPLYTLDENGFVLNSVGEQYVYPWSHMRAVRLARAIGQEGIAIDLDSLECVQHHTRKKSIDERLQRIVLDLTTRVMYLLAAILVLRPSLARIAFCLNARAMLKVLKQVMHCDYFLPAMYLDRSCKETIKLIELFRQHYAASDQQDRVPVPITN